MTPAARRQAAIEIADEIVAGAALEAAYKRWSRASRFAGSKDRAAVRDHLFDLLRCWRSSDVRGGGQSGRARMIGLLRGQGADLESVFTGLGHAPSPLTDAERGAGKEPEGADALDLQDWAWQALLVGRTPEAARREAALLRARAPVDLRVNLLRATRASAQDKLSAEGIQTQVVDLAPTALRVVEGASKVTRSHAYADGDVELQDAASQAVVDAIPLAPGLRVLDYCAGGGGKALAMAAQTQGPIDAHDAVPRRLSEIAPRAARAGATVRIVEDPVGPYDVVLCDVPCSGSGSWRRDPQGKWTLTDEAFQARLEVQAQILDRASQLVGPNGLLAYATCSLFEAENTAQAAAFSARSPSFEPVSKTQWTLSEGGDGFFCALFRRVN